MFTEICSHKKIGNSYTVLMNTQSNKQFDFNWWLNENGGKRTKITEEGMRNNYHSEKIKR